MKMSDDPHIVAARVLIEQARAEFWRRVNLDMAEARERAHSFAAAVGEVSTAVAHAAWRATVSNELTKQPPTDE